MKFENELLQNLDKHVTDLLKNKNARKIIVIALALYILFDIAGFYVNIIMKSNIIKSIVAISIFYLSCRDTTIAIMLLITLVLSLRNIPGQNTLINVRNVVKEVPGEIVKTLGSGVNQKEQFSNQEVKGNDIGSNKFKLVKNKCDDCDDCGVNSQGSANGGCNKKIESNDEYLNNDKRFDDLKHPAYQVQFQIDVKEQEECMKKAPSKICSQEVSNPTGFNGVWETDRIL